MLHLLSCLPNVKYLSDGQLLSNGAWVNRITTELSDSQMVPREKIGPMLKHVFRWKNIY